MSRSIPELLRESVRDPAWLEESLQAAVALEFATIPPYLCALWSIEDPPPPPPPNSNWPPSTCLDAYGVLRGIAVEEMLHMGLVCNMLTAIGSVPDIAGAVPEYPSQGLPGKVRPDLWVSLAGLTHDRVHDLFMRIEYPEYPVPDDPPPPPPPEGDYATIGKFYDAIAAAFQDLEPPIKPAKDITQATFDNHGCIGATPTGPGTGGPEILSPLGSLPAVLAAIETIKEQGEGTAAGPDAPHFRDELAHYYKFGSIFNGALFVPGQGYTGDPIAFPAAAQMQEVPKGGYPDPPQAVAAALLAFNQAFSTVVDGLDAAWRSGNQTDLDTAIGQMFGSQTAPGLADLAAPLYTMTVPGTQLTYGPTFEYLS